MAAERDLPDPGYGTNDFVTRATTTAAELAASERMPSADHGDRVRRLLVAVDGELEAHGHLAPRLPCSALLCAGLAYS